MTIFSLPSRTSQKAITAATILAILNQYRLPSTTPAPSSSTLNPLLQTIQNKVESHSPIHLVLPGFPFKSPTATTTILSPHADKAESLALAHLNTLCAQISAVYPPGATLTIVFTGALYNDLLHIPDHDVWVYANSLRLIATQNNYIHLRFARLHTLQHVLSTPVTASTHAQQSATFRSKLTAGARSRGIAAHLERDEDARAACRAYTRSTEDEEECGVYRTEEEESMMRVMVSRGRTFAAALEKNFPESVHLSAYPTSSSAKFVISLFPTSQSIPWHTSLVFGVDGSIRAANQDDVKGGEVVLRDEKPWFVRERSDVEVEHLYSFDVMATQKGVLEFAGVDMVKLQGGGEMWRVCV